jgi:hypothetical protein
MIRLKGKGVKGKIIFGEAKTTNYESGVYGHEDAELVFGEDDFEDSGSEDENVFLSAESIKSEIKRLGKQTQTAKFDI